MKYSISAVLLGTASAVQVRKDWFLNNRGNDDQPRGQVLPLQYHWNEDPHGVADPLQGKPYMTSTQAGYLKKGLTDLASEPIGINWDFHIPYNKYAREPTKEYFSGV